jgi:hypothetical protein
VSFKKEFDVLPTGIALIHAVLIALQIGPDAVLNENW